MTRHLISKTLLWIVSLSLLLFCFSIVSNAQDTLKRPVHIGFVFPISSNGLQASNVENNFSLHILAGVSLQENALSISGLASIVKGNANGVIVSGIYNHIGYNGNGLQLAGVVNYTRHHLKGVQLAGIFNSAFEAEGIQLAGITNMASSSDIQLSGLANITKQSGGLQVAGFINTGDTVNTQVSGFINVAKKVKGVQVAGFINIADESDYPIGIVNIIKHGEKSIGVSIDELGSVLASLRSGGRVTYGILSAGYNSKKEEAAYVLETGLGIHFLTSEYFRANAEITTSALSDFKGNYYFKSTARIFAGLRLGNRIEVFAGPSFNYMGYDHTQTDIRGDHYLWNERKGTQFTGLFIGGSAGIQYCF